MKNKIFIHAIFFSFGIFLSDLAINEFFSNGENNNWIGSTFKTVFVLLFFALVYGRKYTEKVETKADSKPATTLAKPNPPEIEKEVNFFKK